VAWVGWVNGIFFLGRAFFFLWIQGWRHRPWPLQFHLVDQNLTFCFLRTTTRFLYLLYIVGYFTAAKLAQTLVNSPYLFIFCQSCPFPLGLVTPREEVFPVGFGYSFRLCPNRQELEERKKKMIWALAISASLT
jgi:hypothetical protein